MKLALSRIAQFLVAPASARVTPEVVATGYSIDSRTIQPGELFFAVKGEKMDGHDFVAQAIEKGAVAAVVSRDQQAQLPSGLPLLVVADTLLALQTLATLVRRLWGKPLVGVTGSAGKTTTKEAIAHVIPAIAIAQELQRRYNAECLFIGTARGLETRLVPNAGFPLKLVRVGALNRVRLTTRLKTLFDLPRAVFSAAGMINEFQPAVVIGVGGYASGPAMLASILKHIPRIAFEPNVVPGFANRAVAHFVSAAAVHFKETAGYFHNPSVTGVPVRPAFFEISTKSYEQTSPTLLVFGGSQGARSINQAMIRALPKLTRRVPGVHEAGCAIRQVPPPRVPREARSRPTSRNHAVARALRLPRLLPRRPLL